MPMYVLIPREPGREHLPAIIAGHGHNSGGKVVTAGCAEIPGLAERIKECNYDHGVQFVREGFIAFCPAPRGFGERRESSSQGDNKIFDWTCEQLNHIAYPLGQTVTGMWTWDISRLVNHIEERDDCDSKRVGCAGLSGVRLQSLWASAFNERIEYGYRRFTLFESE